MKILLLFINTIKYLKWQQIYFRFVRKLIAPKITDIYEGVKLTPVDVWNHSALYESKISNNFVANFLNYSKKLRRFSILI